ncbi:MULTISPECIES: hypothetical protein [Clostridium]|uniref:Uncharacterized protein n=1 Tax=Clostridium lapidicellarium TaxID=3240931 RepID=A0ABV4DVY9_9CLOT
MDTNYVFDVTPDKEIVYTEDKQKAIYTPIEELEMVIAESFPESYVDPEKYARKLHDMYMAEYANKYKEVLKS